MSKTKEELDALKEEVEAVNEKLQKLTPEEIAQVNGGRGLVCDKPGLMLRGGERVNTQDEPPMSERKAR